MPRRRRNNSRRGRGGKAQKKSTRLDPEISEHPEEPQVKEDVDNKKKESSEKLKVAPPPSSSVSSFKVHQVPPRKRRAAFILAHDSNEGTTPEKRNTAFAFSDEAAEGRHLLGVVKVEKYNDSDVSLNGAGEESCDILRTSIKTEPLDCSVNSAKKNEEQSASLRVPTSLPNSSLISEIEMSFNAALPHDWFCKASNDGFNVMLLSSCKEKAIQRRIFFPFQGEVEISVHRKILPSCVVNEFLKGLLLPMFLSANSFKDFVNRALEVVRKISNMAVCRGADQDKYQNLWLSERTGVLDSNPYGEATYVITFRSTKCKRLSMNNDWPCEDCVKLLTVLKEQYSILMGQSIDGSGKSHMVQSGSISQFSVPTNKLDLKPSAAHESSLPGESSGVCQEKVESESLSKKTAHEAHILNGNRTSLMVENLTPELQSRAIENKFSTPLAIMPKIAPNILEKAALKTYTGKDMSLSLEAALKRNQQLAENSRYGKIKLLLEKSAVLLENELSQDLLNILKDIKDLSPVQQQFIEMQTELASEKRAFGMKWLPTLIRYALFMKSLSVECTGSGMITLPSGKVLFNFSQVLFRIKKEFQKADIKEILAKPYLKSCIMSESYYVLLMDEIDVSDNLVYQKSNGELIGFVKLSDVKDEMDRIEDFIVADKCFSNRPIPSYTMLVYMIKGVSNSLKEVVALLDAEDVSSEMVYDVTWNIIGILEQHCMKVISVVTNGFPRTKSFFDLHRGDNQGSGQIHVTKNIKANERPLFIFTDASYLLKQIRNCLEESGANGVHQKILTKNKEAIVWKTIERLYLARKWTNLKGSNVFLNEYSRKKASHASAVFSNAVVVDLQSRFWPNTCETVRFISKVRETFGTLLNTDVVEGKVPSEPVPVYTSLDDKRFSLMLGFLDYLSDWKTEVDDIPVISAEDKSKLLLDEELCKELERSLKAFIDVSSFLFKEGIEEIDPNVFWLEPIGQYLEKGWFGFVQTVNSYIKRSVNFHSFTKQTAE